LITPIVFFDYTDYFFSISPIVFLISPIVGGFR